MSENKNAKTPADGPTANRAMTLEEAQQWITTTWIRCQDEVWRQLPTKHMSRESMKQSEALRLADALDAEFVQGRISNHNGRKAAVELRRLHDLVCVCGAVWEGGMMVHPPRKREWVGLTDEERHSIREWQEIQKELGPVWAPMMLYLYEAIGAKLKEKNT